MFDQIIRDIRPELTRMYAQMDATLHSHVPLANRVIDYFRDRKGKGVRPIMTILAARLASAAQSADGGAEGVVTDATIDGAVALELVHNASLMHDDVVDKSDRRRGAETINRVWDNKVAVLMGDYFLSKALLRIHASGMQSVLRVLTDTVTRLSEGELAQLSAAGERLMNEEVYMRVIADKTASMFAACMQIGALSVSAPDDTVRALQAVGEEMGLIFQMRDDLFDYLPSEQMGKPSGHDIREGKITLPLIYAFRTAPADEAHTMLALLDHPAELTDHQVATLVDFAQRHGGIQYTHHRMSQLADHIRAELSHMPDCAARRALLLLVEYFVQRQI